MERGPYDPFPAGDPGDESPIPGADETREDLVHLTEYEAECVMRAERQRKEMRWRATANVIRQRLVLKDFAWFKDFNDMCNAGLQLRDP